MKTKLFLTSLLFFLASCGDKNTSILNENMKIGNGFRLDKMESPLITVLNHLGEPLVGAQVLIGWGVDDPFVGNLLMTSSSGQIEVPSEWQDVLPVTVNAHGYTRVTYFSQTPGPLTFKLKIAPNSGYYHIKGQTQGHNIKDYDDWINASLIFPPFTKQDMLSFNMAQVMSPFSDQINIRGDNYNVPSNISLPVQKERYFVTIKFDKPTYNLYSDLLTVNKAVALKAKFPFNDVVTDLRNEKPFVDLVNHFTIEGGSIKSLNILQNPTVDFDVNEFKFKGKKVFTAPTIQSDEVILGVSAYQLKNELIPTDVKRLESNESLELVTFDQGPSFVAAVLKKKNEMQSNSPNIDRISASFTDFSPQFKPHLLSLINKPQKITDNRFKLPAVNTISGVNPLVTYALISEVKEYGSGNQEKVVTLKRQWEFYAPNWISEIKLPQFPDANTSLIKKRFEISFIGSQTHNKTNLGSDVADVATHITRSSLDY